MKKVLQGLALFLMSCSFLSCSDDAAPVESQNETPTTTETPDTTNPTVGNPTLILAAGGNPNSEISVTWNAASDETTSASNLRYKVVYSTTNNISSVSNAETNGTLAMDFTANTTSFTITGLDLASDYYVMVIVKDEAGNKSVYTTDHLSTTCFVGATLISMEDGSFKRIDQIVSGDRVLSFNENGEITVSTVGLLIEHRVHSYLEIRTEDGMIGATGNHPFYAGRGVRLENQPAGFKAIRDFRTGEFLYSMGEGLRIRHDKILAIETRKEDLNVYNLHISDGNSTFFANGFAVHNY